MSFVFGKTSEQRLQTVHPDLQKVVRRALQLSEVDFSVAEGLRAFERQKELMSEGATRTMKSKHIIGEAVDLYPVGNPIPWEQTKLIAEAMFKAAIELDINIRWGGDWNRNGRSDDEKFYDSPHFEFYHKNIQGAI